MIVNSLWIGSQLSLVELLTLKSFVDHGYGFRLWVYDKITTVLPEGVTLMDANTIIPKEKVFAYANANQFGHGKGSVSGFSDIFRYKLLYDHGGWWVDMDVTCLKPFDHEEPYYFRAHHELPLVGNVMKCPQGSELMLRCYEEALASVNSENTDWHLPIEILIKHVKQLGLLTYVGKGHSNTDRWDELQPYLFGVHQFPDNWYFVHWMNEEWRSRKLDKSAYRYGSAYGKLLENYSLAERKIGVVSNVWNALWFAWVRFMKG